MNGEAYYDYQAQARNLRSDKDVEFLVDFHEGQYDRLLSKWLPKGKNALIYEVACGPGIFLRYLHRRGYTSMVGSDSSPAQIDLARAAKLNVRLVDSIQDLQEQSAESLECIVAIDFIEHLPKDILIRFFAECHRVLKNGGILILRAPNGDSPFVGRNLFNDITHVWAYTTVALTALLRMNSFSAIEFQDESLAAIQRFRFVKVPLMRFAQSAVRLLFRSATREDIRYLSSTLFVAAWK